MAGVKPDKMTDHAHVVEQYLTHTFPHARIEVVLEPEPARREDRGFRILDRQDVYFLNVPSEFLADDDAAAITDYLHRWDVAQLLRDAEAKQVTVLRGEPPIQADELHVSDLGDALSMEGGDDDIPTRANGSRATPPSTRAFGLSRTHAWARTPRHLGEHPS